MKSGIIISILFIDAVLPDIGFGVSIKSSFKHNSLLPWQIIAEKFNEGCWFGSEDISPNNGTQKYRILRIDKADSKSSYTCLPAQPVIIGLPEETVDFGSLRKITVQITEFVEDSWRNVGKTITCSGSDEVSLTGGIGKEGFYSLSFTIVTQDGNNHHLEAYTIICSNWKKDVLTFCREMKEELELNPDAQLIRSCIAISHFDHCMELVSESSFLSNQILKALRESVRSKKIFESGQYPDLVTGLNILRLRRFLGSPIEEFSVLIPDNYNNAKAWPIFLHAGDSGWKGRDTQPTCEKLIDMWWHTVSYKEFRWKDYMTIMELLKEKLNIDENRIYIDGDCMDGISAIAIALHHPDHWAECSSSLGNSYRHLATNALNLPLIFVRGNHGVNQTSFSGYFNFALKCFQYNNCIHFKNSWSQTIVEVRGAPVPEAIRENNPQRVSYTIESLGNPKAYWVKVEGRQDENLVGTIDASVDGQTVFIKTKNINAYNLNLAQAPLDANKPVEIIENGLSMGLKTNDIFTKRNEKYEKVTYIKNENLHGPVLDVFNDPYVVVWGSSSDDKELTEVNKQIAKSLAGSGPVFTDANIPENLLDSHNLILVGTTESNMWLSKISKQLPVLIEKGNVITGDKRYSECDMGFILIYPNPINPQRYVAVFSGTSTKAIVKISEAYARMREIRPADVGIFEIADSDSIKWCILEKFNTVWDWHCGWDRAISVLNKKHPKWQWRQWIAKVVRKQLKADVAILEDPFIFEDSVPVGQITYRDLFNTFENVWFTKVKMNGKDLRALLTISFNDISKRDVDALIIEGVSLVGNTVNCTEEVLTIDGLLDDAVYSVVLPEKCLNGQRMGFVLRDYEIEDQNYLMPILKDYLMKDGNADIETQLDGLKFNIF